ncbi:protein kinase domain-containing protein [Neorhodopirellula lusitana]|uniref:protein kinase domain-containing protein n=1 Tax=Neorhodopirellula lusitana TaxID=445327 RepID=UPI00384D30A5
MKPIECKVVVVNGPDTGREFRWDGAEPLVIGRGSDSDTRICDPKLSRVHFEIRGSVEGGYLLIDRGGSGGVQLDGIGVGVQARLGTKATIKAGDTQLRFEVLSAFDAPTIQPQVASKPVGGVEDNAGESVPLRDLVGQMVHRFRVDKLASSSSNSAVFKAYDTQRERVVALKILQPRLASTEVQRERFIRAMRTMMPIRHDNIVRLYKAGRQGPYCWAAMQWVDGISVRELIEHAGIGGMLDWKEVWRLAIDMSRALEEAAKHHIVHRNVTPSNLLRRQNDKTYLLTDLIFARALEETNAAQLTRPGDVMGDINFLAPERLFDATQCDGRSDQYSLGATLYAFLTGQPPHQAFGVMDLIEKIRTESIEPPHRSQLGLDERFCDVVMKLLSASPDQRYRSPSELLRTLKRVGQLAGVDYGSGCWQ